MNKLLFGLVLSVLVCGAGPARADRLSLQECLHLARQQNLALQSARKTPQVAAEQVRETRSIYLPQVDLNAGYTFQDAPQKVLLGQAEAPTQDKDYAHFSLSAEQLLYDFGRSASRMNVVRAQAEAAGSELASREQDLFLSTTQAYFQVLAAEQLLQSASDEVEQVEAHRRVAAALYDEGVVTRNDLLQAEVRLASSRQQQLVRKGVLDNAWLTLNYLTGRPAEARAELVAETIPDLGAALAVTSLDERPELRAQQQRVAAASAAVEESRGSYLPELFARLGADYVDNSNVKEQTIYSATLGLRVNLFDGQAKAARLRQSLLALDQEKLRLDDVRARTELDYRQASNDARVARRRIDVAETAIVQAQENLRINRERYLAQVGTATEVLDAQTLLTESRTDLALARFDYHVAVARVQRAAGNL
jgi:outer membrane protein TolC